MCQIFVGEVITVGVVILISDVIKRPNYDLISRSLVYLKNYLMFFEPVPSFSSPDRAINRRQALSPVQLYQVSGTSMTIYGGLSFQFHSIVSEQYYL